MSKGRPLPVTTEAAELGQEARSALGLDHEWELAVRLLDITPTHWWKLRKGGQALPPLMRRLLEFAVRRPELTRRYLLGPAGESYWERTFRHRPADNKRRGARAKAQRQRLREAQPLPLTRAEKVARLDKLLDREGY